MILIQVEFFSEFLINNVNLFFKQSQNQVPFWPLSNTFLNNSPKFSLKDATLTDIFKIYYFHTWLLFWRKQKVPYASGMCLRSVHSQISVQVAKKASTIIANKIFSPTEGKYFFFSRLLFYISSHFLLASNFIWLVQKIFWKKRYKLCNSAMKTISSRIFRVYRIYESKNEIKNWSHPSSGHFH